MTFIWLVAWLLSGTPHLDFQPMTDWTIALCVVALIDALECAGH